MMEFQMVTLQVYVFSISDFNWPRAIMRRVHIDRQKENDMENDTCVAMAHASTMSVVNCN